MFSPTANEALNKHAFDTDDQRLRPVYEKVIASQELDAEDLRALDRSTDVLAIGWMANLVRERASGNAALVIGEELFVAPGAGGVELPVRAPDRVAIVSRVAGSFDALLAAIQDCRDRFPAARIAALTLAEVHSYSLTGPRPDEIFAALRTAGSNCLLGEGAELLLPPARHLLARSSLQPAHETALRDVALKSGVEVPLWFAHRNQEPVADRTNRLIELRKVVPGEGIGRSIATFSLPPEAGSNSANVTGMQEMKLVAIARLALPPEVRIRVFLESLGGKLSQIALRFGASDLDASYFSVPGVAPESRREEAVRLARAAGREPGSGTATSYAVAVSV